MNIIGKIVAIIAFVLIILLVINYKSFISIFDNVAFGGGTMSPYQIGASYVEQANKLSPYGAMTGEGGPQTGAVTYGSYVAAQQQQYGAGSNTGTKTKTVSRGKITVEKIDTILVVTTENISISNLSPQVHIWLTNQSAITDTTKYIDFGAVKNGGIQSYSINLGHSNLSLTEYKHVMIINEETHQIYGQSILSKKNQ